MWWLWVLGGGVLLFFILFMFAALSINKIYEDDDYDEGYK